MFKLTSFIDGSLTLPSDKFLDYFEDKVQVRQKHQIVTHDNGSVTLTSITDKNRFKSSRKQLKNITYPTIPTL